MNHQPEPIPSLQANEASREEADLATAAVRLLAQVPVPLQFQRSSYERAVIDAFGSHICIIAKSGDILAVNKAWNDFAAENAALPGETFVGYNYIDICRSSVGPNSAEASAFEVGVRAVLAETSPHFECEYPCHSPSETRWFLGRALPILHADGGALIEHINITAHKTIVETLREEALTDSLTQLPNRRHFMTAGAQELARVGRLGDPATLLMIDIDHFKAINDEYGHAVGDIALESIGAVCRNNLRATDAVARIGGEEFVIILSNTNLTEARSIAERIRKDIGAIRLSVGLDSIAMTASIGLAELTSADQTISNVLTRADQALYAAKRAGRNRVEPSPPPLAKA